MRYLYHATNYENLGNILSDGIHTSADGAVYCTEKPEQAVIFLAVRGVKDILVLKIKMYKADEVNLIETFDHARHVFKFNCYGYTENISTDKIVDYIRYKI